MDRQIDIMLEDHDDGLSVARPLTPLGTYVLGTVIADGGGAWTHAYLDDAECDALEVAAYAHKATLHRA